MYTLKLLPLHLEFKLNFLDSERLRKNLELLRGDTEASREGEQLIEAKPKICGRAKGTKDNDG